MKNFFKNETFRLVIKILLTIMISLLCPSALFCFILFLWVNEPLSALATLLLPAIIPLLWLKKKKGYLITYCSVFLVLAIVLGIQYGIRIYEEKITIDVTPSINVNEYLPFDENSKIVKIDSDTLELTKDPPIIDGAAAAFPVYSAFINAVYPETTRLNDRVFMYNNTIEGYRKLAQRRTDIFVGAQPSKEQLEYAEALGTTFKYTQIGSEAFVFFVHKDNPIDSLTTEQIKAIYSGEITNWSEVGGSDEEIVAFQRNEGSGSQSMMIRFMGDTPLMDAETKEIGGMGDIVEEVADYQSKSGSIGFSFRFYIEGIIKNPDIKMIAIDGIAPTIENIKNGTYPIIEPLYAVTYEGNTNENVDKLLAWILSDEGQYIIEKTGYAGVGN